MTKSATEIADQAVAKMEAEEAGIVNDNGNQGDDNDKNKSDKGAAGEQGTGKTGEDAADKGAAAPKYDKDGKRIEADEDEAADGKKTDDKDKKEGEFTADDALEVEEKKDDTPAAPTDNAGVQLSQAEQKHIADNIGEPIVIRGWKGEGDNAKEVEIKAYSPSDIPADFKFANDQQLAAATSGFQKLEQKANELLGNYRQNQSQTQAQDFEKRENEGIRADVADLQKEGKFPKFTVRPGAAGFDDSPEAQQMAEVLSIMSEKNETYFKQYQQGRPYKHIGFAEAFDIWEAKSPERQKAKKTDEDQKNEDEERKTAGADRASTNNHGSSQYNIQKPTVKSGTTTRDIMARIDAMD